MKPWKERNNKLCKKFVFSNFKEAMSFIIKVGRLAEQHNHHPEIYNIYNRVEISLSTHDKGNIVTKRDYLLAKAIDSIQL